MTEDMLDRSHQDQFRLTRLQVVNWGTFCGYKDFAIDKRGVLFTGPSGSGKSSLMDAHSMVLLPTNDQRFNASADLTARGSKQSTRSVVDYVRGAWSETNDEHEQSQTQYLRSGRPTWSAIAATYDNGHGVITTAVVVKWFTGVDNDPKSMKTLRQLHDGSFELTALEEWADRGFDTTWLKHAVPAFYPPSQESYMRELAQRIGLGTSKTALSLLGKAKAMKNVGALDLFIRENMLDRPETFAACTKMLEAFTPLNEAYQIAQRAHNQELILRDVPSSWITYCESGRTHNLAEALLGTPMERYLRGVHLRSIDQERNSLDEAIDALDTKLAEEQQHEERARDAYLSLEQQLRSENEPLRHLQVELDAANTEVRSRQHAYQLYSGQVARLSVTCPQDEQAFTALRDQLPAIGQQAHDEQAALQAQRHSVYAALAQAEERYDERSAELEALRSAASLIPQRAVRRREFIAQHTGVPLAQLPYAAELIDVADDQERWRPAAERVLRTFGLRLLVPEQHKDTISQFIDTNNMRGLIEYSIVTATSAHQPRPDRGFLAGKLIVDTDHPCGPWLLGQLVKKFDHVCVDNPRELDHHTIAVTINGTVKSPGNHYRKDDRSEAADPSSYILGANTRTKRAALEAAVAELDESRQKAKADADEIDSTFQNLSTTLSAVEQLRTYSSWSQLNFWNSQGHVRQLEERIEQIRADNVNLNQLEKARDEAKRKWNSATETRTNTKNKIAEHSARQTHLTERYEQEQRKPHSVDDEEHRTYLDEVYAELDVPVTTDSMPQVQSAFRKELEKHKSSAESQRKLAHTTLKNALDHFISRWPDTAPDTSGDVDHSGGDFAALHEEITQRRLPGAMNRFQRMISEDMVPSVSVLQRTIEKATSEIKQRIDMVNAGLRQVEFNAGTHLQIAYKANPSDDVKEFRRRVDLLLRNVTAAQKDPHESVAQFQRVRELMGWFTSEDSVSQRWSTNVLDVRESYTFYGLEQDSDGRTVHTYRNTASNSGGEQEKLVAFCLAAALSYNLARSDCDGTPHFAPLMLDEAFSKSDENFSAQALAAFEQFGFQLLIAAPIRMSGILEPFIGQAILVEKRTIDNEARSDAASATFGELTNRRIAESDGVVHAPA
ncbi:Uncharacterized protein YPO0396 [Actinopolyspora mzabensis]|uniref:Uncharacterized protein YPO0396 n=1 Tax=Actinopolyspora mzabensis TaxID=995066 RepID=A0A1G8ZXK3_ACTMZ|nr:SbcC/MukB-like Walker B domain-containing protein [Actinopolyspora mzabensis]SDK19846.1 Uncharacterized protein YPO0396 [Actinopolyspora mzabensis]